MPGPTSVGMGTAARVDWLQGKFRIDRHVTAGQRTPFAAFVFSDSNLSVLVVHVTRDLNGKYTFQQPGGSSESLQRKLDQISAWAWELVYSSLRILALADPERLHLREYGQVQEYFMVRSFPFIGDRHFYRTKEAALYNTRTADRQTYRRDSARPDAVPLDTHWSKPAHGRYGRKLAAVAMPQCDVSGREMNASIQRALASVGRSAQTAEGLPHRT